MLTAFVFRALSWLAFPAEDPLAALLRSDYEGAKVVYLTGNRGKSVAVSDLDPRQATVLVSFDDDARGIRLSRPYFSSDAKQVIVSYEGRCYVLNADGSGKRQILADEYVGEASFWDDPVTVQRCVVCCGQANDEKRDKGETYLFRPLSGTKTLLADSVVGDRDVENNDGWQRAGVTRGDRLRYPLWRAFACGVAAAPDGIIWHKERVLYERVEEQ